MKGYTTKEKIVNYLMVNIDSSFDDQVEDWIMESEEYIDHVTDRNFKADSVVSQRRYDGDNTQKLLIDDCVSISEIKLSADSEALDSDNYFLYPQNAQLLSRKKPYTMIKLLAGVFPKYPPAGIYVKAKWGYSAEVPADIQNVATVLVAGIINFSWNSEGEVQSETVGRYTVTYKTKKEWQDFERIETILKSYLKYSF